MDLTAQIYPEELLPRPSELEMVLMAGVLLSSPKSSTVNICPIARDIYYPRTFTLTAARTTLDRLCRKGYLRSVVAIEEGVGRNPAYYRLTPAGRRSMTAAIQVMVRVWKAVEHKI